MSKHNNWRDYTLPSHLIRYGNEMDLLRNGEEAFPRMLETMNQARESILLEVYQFGEDVVGQKFRELLEKKAREGISVYLIYDAMGSLYTSWSFFDHMREAGINVAQYHPLVPWKPYWAWFRRNHRKVLIVDRKIGFAGGLNLNANNGPRPWGGLDWRDTQICLAGPAIREAISLFWNSWKKCGEKPPPNLTAYPFPISQTGETPAVMVSGSGLRARRSIRRSYKYAINRARRYIYITNAYFLPGRTIYWRLEDAVRRGVRVAIIAPGQTDHPYVRWASWALYGRLLRNGIEIYEWQPTVLHAKTAVIDGIWSSVGSHNLDHRSLHYNLEVNINVLDAEFGEKMRKMFEEDLRQCRQITLDEWKNQRFLFKAASRVLYWLRYWL